MLTRHEIEFPNDIDHAYAAIIAKVVLDEKGIRNAVKVDVVLPSSKFSFTRLPVE